MAEALLVEPDVAAAQRLTTLLDNAEDAPKAVLWVYSNDTGGWRLWIVPRTKILDQRAYYTKLSILLEKNNSDDLDIGMIKIVDEENPAIRGLRGFIRAEGVSSIRFRDNVLNGVYLPDAVIVRMAV